ncbi:hypothetical protein GQ42DRAFT_159026 [Ramicandelaber brevisporus]|nr:hypothetical protein GQ42DRAFT_159026 [Ramicandelaber brevisporus]
MPIAASGSTASSPAAREAESTARATVNAIRSLFNQLLSFIKTLPLFTWTVVFLTLGTVLLTQLLQYSSGGRDYLPFHLAFIPGRIVHVSYGIVAIDFYWKHLHTLVTYPYVYNSILGAAFGLWITVYLLSRAEKRYGTTRAAWITIVVFSTVPALVLMLLSLPPLSKYSHVDPFTTFMGLHSVFMSWLAWFCTAGVASPDHTNIQVFGIASVQAHALPILAFLLELALGPRVPAYVLQSFIALVLGYMLAFDKLRWLVISERYAGKLEQLPVIRWVAGLRGFRKAATTATVLPSFVQSAVAAAAAATTSSSTGDTRFPGTGMRLGGGGGGQQSS